MISKYFEARRRAKITYTRFFLGVKPVRKESIVEYFRDQTLGRITCSKIINEVCQKLDIRGNGEAGSMTAHGLTATMISLLISAGYPDAAVVLRTGHCDTTSLQSYHNFRENEGEMQLNAVPGGRREG